VEKLKTPRRLEFHIVYRCVNRCVFCSERDHMRAFAEHPAPPDELARVLRAKRAEGYEHVTFTGGEPTLYPRVWEPLSLAKELGYRTFMISNGAALAMPAFAERVLPFIDELCLSLHGPTAAVHDALTGRRGSFARQLAAFANVERHARDVFVLVNTVVSRRNVALLPRTLKLAGRHAKVRHFLASNLAPEGEALRRYPELSVRHEEIARRLPEMSKYAKRRGIDLRIFGVPLCALGEHRRLSNDLYYSPRVTVARARLEDGSVGWFEEVALGPTRERSHPPVCEPCAYRDRCGGVFSRYLTEYGAEGIVPILDEWARRGGGS